MVLGCSVTFSLGLGGQSFLDGPVWEHFWSQEGSQGEGRAGGAYSEADFNLSVSRQRSPSYEAGLWHSCRGIPVGPKQTISKPNLWPIVHHHGDARISPLLWATEETARQCSIPLLWRWREPYEELFTVGLKCLEGRAVLTESSAAGVLHAVSSWVKEFLTWKSSLFV